MAPGQVKTSTTRLVWVVSLCTDGRMRANARSLDRRHVEGLVGRQPAVSHARFRADAPSAPVNHNARRHDRFTSSLTAIEAALDRATDAAKGQDVRLGGGVATIREYLRAQLIDEMHLAIAPVLLGSGEHLLSGIDLLELGYQCSEHVATPGATHVIITKRTEALS